MGMSIRMGVDRFKEQLRAELGVLQRATRPAAQAGVQVIYDRARIYAPVSAESHHFTIRGQKYGPYAPGNLRDSVYQVYSKDKSYKDVSTYHVSFNLQEAPYGIMVHNGTSRMPANPFILRAVMETRSQAREAIKAKYIEEVTKS